MNTTKATPIYEMTTDERIDLKMALHAALRAGYKADHLDDPMPGVTVKMVRSAMDKNRTYVHVTVGDIGPVEIGWTYRMNSGDFRAYLANPDDPGFGILVNSGDTRKAGASEMISRIGIRGWR